MKCIITREEKLIQYPDKKFVYFDYIGKERRTIISPSVLTYLKIDNISVGDVVNIQKTIRQNKESYFITKIFLNNSNNTGDNL